MHIWTRHSYLLRAAETAARFDEAGFLISRT